MSRKRGPKDDTKEEDDKVVDLRKLMFKYGDIEEIEDDESD